LAILPADAYVAVIDINDQTTQFVTVPYDYTKKQIIIGHPNQFYTKDIKDLHTRF